MQFEPGSIQTVVMKGSRICHFPRICHCGIFLWGEGIWEAAERKGLCLPSICLRWWKIHLQCRRPWFNSWATKFPWRRERLPTPVFLGFPGGSDGKEYTYNAGDLGSITGLGRSSGGGHGNPFQYSCLENPHGWRSLVGYSLEGRRGSDMTERLSTAM